MKKNYLTPAILVAFAATTNIMNASNLNDEQGSGEQLSKKSVPVIWNDMEDEEDKQK